MKALRKETSLKKNLVLSSRNYQVKRSLDLTIYQLRSENQDISSNNYCKVYHQETTIERLLECFILTFQKKGDIIVPSIYRDINVTVVVSKIYNMLIFNCIQLYFSSTIRQILFLKECYFILVLANPLIQQIETKGKNYSNFMAFLKLLSKH